MRFTIKILAPTLNVALFTVTWMLLVAFGVNELESRLGSKEHKK
jgi:hypothetical protein